MSGRRTKALKRELIVLIGRGPRKPTYQLFSSGFVQQKTKDEFRTYKKAWKQTRFTGRPARGTNPGCNPKESTMAARANGDRSLHPNA